MWKCYIWQELEGSEHQPQEKAFKAGPFLTHQADTNEKVWQTTHSAGKAVEKEALSQTAGKNAK